MKKIILSLVIMLGMVSAVSAQTYKENFKSLLTVSSSSISTQNLASMLKPALGQLTGSYFSDEMAERYLSTQFADDFSDVIMPYFEKSLTDQDMQDLLASYNQPNVKSVVEKMNSLSSENLSQDVMNKLQEPIMTLMFGGTADDVKLADGVSEEYATAYTQFCEHGGMFSSFEAMKSLLSQNGMGSKLDPVISYLSKNMPRVMANMYNGKITMEDLKSIDAVYTTTAYKHFSEGMDGMMGNLTTVLQQLSQKVTDWANKNK